MRDLRGKSSPGSHGRLEGRHMRSKRVIYWALSVPAVVILLIIIIVRLDASDHCISRAAASKAIALALTDKESCLAQQKEKGSHFVPEERSEWYTKYIDYLIENEYFESDAWERDGAVDRDFAKEPLTYGEAAYAAERVSKGLSGALNISKKKYSSPMPKEEWWLFYESFLKKADGEKAVVQEDLLLYGTPDNVKEAAAYTAYTDKGIMGFEGVALDSCIDREIRVYARGSEIIALTGVISDQVTYENVWITSGADGEIQLYIGTIVRTFPRPSELEDEVSGVLGDVSLDRGDIKKISLKKDVIEGKVLAVREDTIEIEGYGTLKLDDNFKVYKTYGVVKEQKKKDIVVGYDLGKFVVAGKKVCAALLTQNFSAKNIRVLIMDDSFSTLFHSSISLQSESTLKLEYGETEEIIEPGKKLVIEQDDERLQEGRLTITPEDPQKQTAVLSISRNQGTPEYFGSFEICRETEGLLLINEVDVEDYLTRVVPSEMPASYELEALKAQAVCARTYAYRQIQANAYSQYGAHVDDSTNYQVYNNIQSSERTDLAVKETDGEMVFYGDKPAETYYFSTSCGYTTDGTIWGASLDDLPYLKGKGLTEDGAMADLTDNDSFVPFIQGQGEPNYDSGFPLYRWKTTITNKKLAEKIDGIGEILGVFVTSRGTGGIAQTVTVVGSEGEKTLEGQTQIRNVLGRDDLTYIKNDGSEMTGWASLPSAFIAADETARDEEKGTRTFTIWGGGYGHGVGMSQNGAQEMARRGKTYEEILCFFYDGAEVDEISGHIISDTDT